MCSCRWCPLGCIPTLGVWPQQAQPFSDSPQLVFQPWKVCTKLFYLMFPVLKRVSYLLWLIQAILFSILMVNYSLRAFLLKEKKKLLHCSLMRKMSTYKNPDFQLVKQTQQHYAKKKSAEVDYGLNVTYAESFGFSIRSNMILVPHVINRRDSLIGSTCDI